MAASPTGKAPAARPPSAATRPPRRGRVRRLALPSHAGLWMLGLASLAAAFYANSLDVPFLLDDPINIGKNEAIKRPIPLSELIGNPRAVVSISLRWNFASGGLDVAGYHLLNILAHALSGILVFLLAFATLRLPGPSERDERAAAGLAAVVAAIFLLHPIQTGAVTYIIQRAEIFAAGALVAALLAFVAMRDGPRSGPMAALVAACLFGAYSKPSFVVVPAVLLAYDFFLVARTRVRDMASRAAIHAVAIAAGLFTFWLSRQRGSMGGATAGFDIEGIAPTDYVSAQFGVIVYYLRQMLWPDGLCFDCGYRGPWPVLSSALGDSVMLPVGILLALVLVSLLACRRYPLFAFAVFASAAVLAPTTLIPLADFYVEHRVYLPIAFLALALVPVASDAATLIASRLGAPAALLPRLRIGLAAVVCVLLGLLTIDRNALLADPIAMMEDSLKKAPQNERVHYNLANAYKREGRLDDAIPHYEEAIRLSPHVGRTYMNYGSLLLQQGKVEEALATYRAGAEARPDMAMTHRNVATAAARLGRWVEALESADRSLTIEAKNPNGLRLRATALDRLGRRNEAIDAYRALQAVVPADPEARSRLAALGAP